MCRSFDAEGSVLFFFAGVEVQRIFSWGVSVSPCSLFGSWVFLVTSDVFEERSFGVQRFAGLASIVNKTKGKPLF